MELNLLVGSGGVLSHAPRRHQAARMLIDAFCPEGITELAVDSIFMMPQLGVLSTIHPDAALEVFNKDCLIRLGTCIAPIGKYIANKVILSYTMIINEDVIKGELKCGEIILIPVDYNNYDIMIEPVKGYDIGNGQGNAISKTIKGGEVGIIFDGRGRPLHFNTSAKERVNAINNWSKITKEYPE